MLFRCPEADAYLARGVQQYEIRQPGLYALMTSYGDGRWVLMFDDDGERSPADLVDDPVGCLAEVMCQVAALAAQVESGNSACRRTLPVVLVYGATRKPSLQIR